MSDISEVCHLNSNIDVEYFKWHRYHRTTDAEYRWDLETGKIYNPDEYTYTIQEKTYFMNYNEYPIYTIYGKYLGFYTSSSFYKPISRRNLGSSREVKSDPWSV